MSQDIDANNEAEKIGQNLKIRGGAAGGSKVPSANYDSALSSCIYASLGKWN